MVRVMIQFGIPAFFYMSGFAATFFDTSKKNFITYFKERFVRLILPFIFGCVFLLTPRMYLSQYIQVEDVNKITDEFEWNIFKFFVILLPNCIIHMSWLWFLLGLFVDSIINYPLLKWTQRRYAGEPITFKDDGLTLLGNLLLHIFWAVFLFVLCGDEFVSSLLPMVILLIINQALFHVIPWKLVKNREDGYKYSYYLRVIGALSTSALCICKINAH